MSDGADELKKMKNQIQDLERVKPSNYLFNGIQREPEWNYFLYRPRRIMIKLVKSLSKQGT